MKPAFHFLLSTMKRGSGENSRSVFYNLSLRA